MPEDNSTTVSEESATKKSLLKRLFGLYEIIPIVLILLSIIGIGITDYSPAESRRYWFAMVPVFAGACLILEWSRARGKGQKWTTIVRNQQLLWFGLHTWTVATLGFGARTIALVDTIKKTILYYQYPCLYKFFSENIAYLSMPYPRLSMRPVSDHLL